MADVFPKDLFPKGSEDLFTQYFGDEEELKVIFEEQRNRYLTLLQMEGTPVKLLQKKTSGVRCPHWNEESQQCSRPMDNPKCFNTGWVGGYEKPIDMLVRFVSPNMEVSWYHQGQRVTKIPRSWTIWTPMIKPFDVFVKTQTGEKFIVQSVQLLPQWRNDLTLFQEMDLTLVTSEPVRFFGPNDGLVLP